MSRNLRVPPELRYDLLAILQHVLDAVERCDAAVEEARHRGDSDLAEAFRKIRDGQTEQLAALRELLDREDAEALVADLPRIAAPADDVVDEASRESFPASDAPGY